MKKRNPQDYEPSRGDWTIVRYWYFKAQNRIRGSRSCIRDLRENILPRFPSEGKVIDQRIERHLKIIQDMQDFVYLYDKFVTERSEQSFKRLIGYTPLPKESPFRENH